MLGLSPELQRGGWRVLPGENRVGTGLTAPAHGHSQEGELGRRAGCGPSPVSGPCLHRHLAKILCSAEPAAPRCHTCGGHRAGAGTAESGLAGPAAGRALGAERPLGAGTWALVQSSVGSIAISTAPCPCHRWGGMPAFARRTPARPPHRWEDLPPRPQTLSLQAPGNPGSFRAGGWLSPTLSWHVGSRPGMSPSERDSLLRFRLPLSMVALRPRPGLTQREGGGGCGGRVKAAL